MSDPDPWTAPPEPVGEPAPHLRALPKRYPYVGIAHRPRPSRRVAAFTMGIAVGAAATWIIVVVATALGRSVAG